MQSQSIPQQTIPQHLLDRMEAEWRQMRSTPAPVQPTPATKPQG